MRVFRYALRALALALAGVFFPTGFGLLTTCIETRESAWEASHHCTVVAPEGVLIIVLLVLAFYLVRYGVTGVWDDDGK